jgi:hypothetical protein
MAGCEQVMKTAYTAVEPSTGSTVESPRAQERECAVKREELREERLLSLYN